MRRGLARSWLALSAAALLAALSNASTMQSWAARAAKTRFRGSGRKLERVCASCEKLTHATTGRLGALFIDARVLRTYL